VNDPSNPPILDRRTLLSGSIGMAAMTLAPAANAVPAASLSTAAPRPVTMTDAQRVDAFMKMRSATDGRLTIGWLDGMNYAFIEGETFPMYRLLAATWYLFEQTSETQYDGLNVEVAFFLDPQTGERLKKLTMPKSGKVVDVPLYRAGPSPISVVPHRETRQNFGMPSEGPDGKNFFNSGTAVSRQWLSQPQRAGELFLIREDSDTVVTPADPNTPGFFYREWTLSQAKWADAVNPSLKCVRAELGYSAATAWRPWMQMGKSPGCTLQNGRGGKALSPEELPPETLALVKELQPDLLDDPVKILKARKEPSK
jgi:hypothetical protein